MKYEFLEHTADIKFRAYGQDLNECFENAAQAMFESITNTKKVKADKIKTITVEAEDQKALLYDFLEELLYLHEAEDYVFNKVTVKIKGNKLTATVYGEKINNHEFNNLVKAITYNDMIVSDKMIQVVLDI